jgi:predicted membrane protein
VGEREREREPAGGMTAGVLLWGLLFSSIGLGFFLYGKKQRAVVPLVCGIALMIYPYFIPNVIALVAIGVVLTAVPYFLRL